MASPRPVFGSILRETLRRTGVRQSELARIVNLSPQVISQLINGDYAPTVEKIEAIAGALRVSPSDLDPSWTRRRTNHLESMPGIEIGYCDATIDALKAGRTALAAQAPPASLKPGAGKPDALLFDCVTEQAIAGRLLAFNSKCAVITEETGVIGERKHASTLSYVVDPFDRSRPFFRAVEQLYDRDKHRTLKDILSDPQFEMQALEAPFGSVTCVRDGEIVFNAMLDYVSGNIYVACKGFIGYGNIDRCPDLRSLAERGHEITFSPKPGPKYLCFTGDPDKDKERTVSEQSTNYVKVLKGLGFELQDHLGLSNPGGPARILYLSDQYSDDSDPFFILSNGEKVFEFLGWVAYAIHSRDLAVYELYSDGFEARGLILQAPPSNYSAFVPGANGKDFKCNVDKIIDLTPPGHYRGALVITHARSTVVCAVMCAKLNSRQLFHPVR
jgi:transcriptional regulator with XRE-family HTH domain